MKIVEINKKKEEKLSCKNMEPILFIHMNQIIFINKLFLEENFENKTIIVRELEKKLNCYKSQDKEKNLLDDNLINLSEIIEKLVASKLKCYYCRQELYVLYRNILDKTQWTLDRIDNNLGHSCENTLIACLKCNLERRRQNMLAFKFSKQLKIKKLD